MAALIFLAIGLLCALIGRILLVGAAFGVSVGWGLGVLLPFGPLLFRLSYPDLAPLSRKFRLATLPCVLLYFILGGASPSSLYQRHFSGQTQLAHAPFAHYGLEAPGRGVKDVSASSGPLVELMPNTAERRAINAREFERLRAWSEKLRLRKRDLLHSDIEGNRAYNVELAQYNAALDKANAEKNSLAALTK